MLTRLNSAYQGQNAARQNYLQQLSPAAAAAAARSHAHPHAGAGPAAGTGGAHVHSSASGAGAAAAAGGYGGRGDGGGGGVMAMASALDSMVAQPASQLLKAMQSGAGAPSPRPPDTRRWRCRRCSRRSERRGFGPRRRRDGPDRSARTRRRPDALVGHGGGGESFSRRTASSPNWRRSRRSRAPRALRAVAARSSARAQTRPRRPPATSPIAPPLASGRRRRLAAAAAAAAAATRTT